MNSKNPKILCLTGLLLLIVAACSEDEFQLPKSEPLINLSSNTISGLPGGTALIEAKITDPVGLAEVQIVYSNWSLQENIAISEAVECDLMYELSVPEANEIGSSHDIKIIATNVNGVSFEIIQPLILNMDINAPEISNNTKPGIAFLKEGTDLTIELDITDNMIISTFTIVGPSLSEEIVIESSSFSYSRELNIQSEGIYEYQVTVNDEGGNSTTEKVKVAAYNPFEKMYLADVNTDQELNSDLMGVPMLINSFENEDSVGKVFEAYYYNEEANTEIRFIPSKESFAPVAFGADSEPGKLSVASDVSVSPIILESTGYTKISLDFRDMSYSVEPYTPSDTPFDTIVVHGTGGVLVNGEQLEGWNPALAKLLTPDNDNPYQFHGVIELFDPSGDNSGAGGSFILGATIGGWQPFWRFDDGSEPEITVPNGGETYTFGSESYGTYDVTFDTHLNRFKATSNN